MPCPAPHTHAIIYSIRLHASAAVGDFTIGNCVVSVFKGLKIYCLHVYIYLKEFVA